MDDIDSDLKSFMKDLIDFYAYLLVKFMFIRMIK